MDFSIIIPTYNRRDYLKRTLELLSKQSKYKFSVIISDNCSSYDVNDVVESFSPEFQDNICVMKNPVNIGMAGNIASCFTKMTSDWCWFLADDDMPGINAVETIFDDIAFAQKENIGVIQYPHYDIQNKIIERKVIISNLKEYVDYFDLLYESGVTITKIQGSNIWLSNKVFSKKSIQDYIQFAFQYANTGIPQTIPILKMLEKQSSKMMIHNKIVVEYPEIGEEEKTWNVREIAIGISTLSYLPLDVDFEVKKKVCFDLMMKYKYLLDDYRKNGKTDVFLLNTVYENMYKYILPETEKEFFTRLIELAKDGKDMDLLLSIDLYGK